MGYSPQKSWTQLKWLSTYACHRIRSDRVVGGQRFWIKSGNAELRSLMIIYMFWASLHGETRVFSKRQQNGVGTGNYIFGPLGSSLLLRYYCSGMSLSCAWSYSWLHFPWQEKQTNKHGGELAIRSFSTGQFPALFGLQSEVMWIGSANKHRAITRRPATAKQCDSHCSLLIITTPRHLIWWSLGLVG